MDITLLNTGARSAHENMEIDRTLLENLEIDADPILHLYQWEPEAITYGHFTSLDKHIDIRAMNKKGLKAARRVTGGGVTLHFTDYAFLQINSFLVLSDSGSISEESSILKFKSLNLRNTHERHEAMEEGTVMMVGMDIKRVLRGIKMIIDGKLNDNLKIVKDYKVDNVSSKIVKIINSYIPYINKNIWKK